MRIMIIEDEADIRAFLQKSLTIHDPELEITEAPNGMEAVRMIAADPPEGIILDMLMPDMDGWEFLQIMDALESEVPIIILTAVHRDNATLCGIMTAHSNVLSIENKPLSIDDIGRVIDLLKSKVQNS